MVILNANSRLNNIFPLPLLPRLSPVAGFGGAKQFILTIKNTQKKMKTYQKTTPEIRLRKKNGQMLSAQIKSSKDAETYFREIFDNEQLEVREQAMAIFLNNANNTIGYYLVSIGGITGTVIDPRTVFRAALECGATSFILAHNHPSGQLKASEPDKTITEKLKQGGTILDIRLLDHIILTADGFLSMADEGII